MRRKVFFFICAPPLPRLGSAEAAERPKQLTAEPFFAPRRRVSWLRPRPRKTKRRRNFFFAARRESHRRDVATLRRLGDRLVVAAKESRAATNRRPTPFPGKKNGRKCFFSVPQFLVVFSFSSRLFVRRLLWAFVLCSSCRCCPMSLPPSLLLLLLPSLNCIFNCLRQSCGMTMRWRWFNVEFFFSCLIHEPRFSDPEIMQLKRSVTLFASRRRPPSTQRESAEWIPKQFSAFYFSPNLALPDRPSCKKRPARLPRNIADNDKQHITKKRNSKSVCTF